ncbi:MAG: AmmeMemoRadiSam system radical SAM enzyme [Spirochaetaceae bacterium]|nr:AmmeMemoRadiSam system radical SAM enzyme [Spirochaetaceae bacterium]
MSEKSIKNLTPLFFEFSEQSEQEKAGKCTLCPNFCIIKAQKFGKCHVRGYDSSLRPIIPFAGKISALAVDPIEKKPLYHFYPQSQILSAGFYSCNLSCPFCQNYNISTKVDPNAKTISPQEMAEITASSNTIGLAYTYSEPMIHIEWVKETAKLLRARNLKNVLVTNGYISEKAGESILEHIDALNIDLKSFNEKFYTDELGAKLEPVKDFIKLAASKAHVEVTTLVIPGKNDSDKEIGMIASFIASIDKSIPLHLSCYYPTYKYSIERTSPTKVINLASIASKYLEYVYVGNAGLAENNTKCPSCNSLIVRRSGYNTEVVPAIAGMAHGSAACPGCGKKINLVL